MQVDLCRWQSWNFHARQQTQQLVNTLKTFPSCYCNIDRGKHLGAGFCSQDYNHAADLTSPWPQLVVFVIWSPVGMKSIASFFLFFLLILSCLVYDRAETWLRHKSCSALDGFCPNSVLGDLQKRQRNPLGSVEPQPTEGSPMFRNVLHICFATGLLEALSKKLHGVSFSYILKVMEDIHALHSSHMKLIRDNNSVTIHKKCCQSWMVSSH